MIFCRLLVPKHCRNACYSYLPALSCQMTVRLNSVNASGKAKAVHWYH